MGEKSLWVPCHRLGLQAAMGWSGDVEHHRVSQDFKGRSQPDKYGCNVEPSLAKFLHDGHTEPLPALAQTFVQICPVKKVLKVRFAVFWTTKLTLPCWRF